MACQRIHKYLWTCDYCGTEDVVEHVQLALPTNWKVVSISYHPYRDETRHACPVCYPIALEAEKDDPVAQAALHDRREEVAKYKPK